MLITAGLGCMTGVLCLYFMRQISRNQRAEQQTRHSEERCRLLLQSGGVTEAIYMISVDGVIESWNAGAERIKGYKPAEIIGQNFSTLFIPDDVARGEPARFLAAARENDGPFTTTCWRMRKDGSRFWARITIDKIFKDDGTLRGFANVTHDITIERLEQEQREILSVAQKALLESEERYRLLLQSGGVTEAIYMIGVDGVIESWNAGAERIKGYKPAEIIGRNFSTFFTPDDIARGEPARLLATARDNDGPFTTTGWRMRKDGSRFWAHVTLDKVYRDDGTLRGFAKVTHDITLQRADEEQRELLKVTQNALSASEERLRLLLQSGVTEALYLLNSKGTIETWNASAARIKGYNADEIIGQHFSKFFTPEDIAIGEPERILKIAAETGRYSTESWRVRKDGTRFRARVALDTIYNNDRTVRGFVKVTRDVTQLRLEEQHRDELMRHLAQARDQAKQASQAKSRFLATMSHELRTPLNGILGYAHLLRMDGGLNPTQAKRLDAMVGAGQHLLEMITCVLELSEIEAEHVTLRPVEVDLSTIMAATIDLVRPTAEAKGLDLVCTAAPGVTRKQFVDPTRLRQILLNLLGNAVKFTTEGTIELRLRTGAASAVLRIEVADTGPGIPAELRNRLFGEFDRLETDGHVKLNEGAGLGLAVSARLATLMGGKLGYDDNPDGGSVFWLELPLNSERPPIAAAAVVQECPDLRPATSPVRILNVLVVDDVLMNREIAAAFLRPAGHAVTCVEGGAEAVAAAASNDFDVILMDVRMPGMDGLEATRRIRALGGKRGATPIIALTAQAFSDQIAQCHEAGMDSHLAKPFEPDALAAAVMRVFVSA